MGQSNIPVWLADIPVATLRPNGATVAIYYIHSDQLNTPRQITRPSDHTPMWTCNADPFGTDAANPNPAGAGIFAYNLRFPGQVFDGQAGLHENSFRDFDPAVGDFIEADPTGLTRHIGDPILKLAMGISARSGEQRDRSLNFPYSYVGANPVSFVDPQGTDRSDRSRDRPDRDRPDTPRDPPADDWRGQCIMLYTMCVQERWIGPCGECLNKCTAQQEWPFKGAPPACRPRPPSSCPKP